MNDASTPSHDKDDESSKYPYIRPTELHHERLAVDAEDVEDFIEHFTHHEEHEKAHKAERAKKLGEHGHDPKATDGEQGS